VKLKTNIFLLFAFFLLLADTYSQVIVFSDDFSDYTDPAWTTSGNLNGSAWDVYRSGVDFGARRNDTPIQMELSNDVSGAANASGYALVNTSTAAFTSPYNTILGNGGFVSWTFNMRQIRTDPSGFDSGNYGVAFILAGESATDNMTGNGYAVVLGQGGGTDPVRLVKYSAGIFGNGSITNIISSSTAGLADFGLEHLSVKVTFNPCNGGTWELFLRNDGTSFMDPLSGTLVSQGTATDNTYTGTALNMMAAYWQGSTVANQTAFFSTVSVSVTAIPGITPGVNPVVCSGLTSANLPYTAPVGSPNQYSINWNPAAEAEGFVDVIAMPLPASPIVLTIPGGAIPAMYNGELTVINSTTMCESDPYPIMVTINALPVVSCPPNITVCSDLPSFALTGGTPSGGTYSGPGVTAGMFNPATAPAGDNVITYLFQHLHLYDHQQHCPGSRRRQLRPALR
jgi:trimeric autotransporter adhesin